MFVCRCIAEHPRVVAWWLIELDPASVFDISKNQGYNEDDDIRLYLRRLDEEPRLLPLALRLPGFYVSRQIHNTAI
jgi:hypothetical protein